MPAGISSLKSSSNRSAMSRRSVFSLSSRPRDSRLSLRANDGAMSQDRLQNYFVSLQNDEASPRSEIAPCLVDAGCNVTPEGAEPPNGVSPGIGRAAALTVG